MIIFAQINTYYMDSKAQCIAFLEAHDWELWDGQTNFTRGYALAKRAGGSSYVAIKRVGGTNIVVKDFNPKMGAILGLSEIYVSERREKTKEELEFDLKAVRNDNVLEDNPITEDVPFSVDDLKTVAECRAYLKTMGLSNMAKGNKTYEQLMKIIKDNL